MKTKERNVERMDISSRIQTEMEKGSLLDVLKAAQEAEGYLSEDVIRQVAAAYGRAPSEIYETATFYSMLKVNKPADHVIEVCGSTCCDAGGAAEVMKAIEEELGVGLGEATPDGAWYFRRCECLGRCNTAPNVVIDGALSTGVGPDEVRELIRKAGK